VTSEFRSPAAEAASSRAQPSGHEDDPVLEVPNGLEEPGDLREAQDHGERLRLPRQGEGLDGPVLPAGGPGEEPQRADALVERAPGDAALDEGDLVGPDVPRAEERGGLPEVAGELGHPLDVRPLGLGGEVPDLHVFEHPLP
jgi:hypothetical protein